MSRNIMNLTKWLNVESNENKQLFASCQIVKQEAELVVLGYNEIVIYIKRNKSIDIEMLEKLVADTDKITGQYRKNHFKVELQPFVQKFKMKNIINMLWRVKLKLTFFIQELMNDSLQFYAKEGEKLLENIFKLAGLYNELCSLDNRYGGGRRACMCSNVCPALSFPTRRLSVTRVLQLLSAARAEPVCHRLIDTLLAAYRPSAATATTSSGLGSGADTSTSPRHEDSDNSSIEIYKALTRHMTPPIESAPPQPSKVKEDVPSECEDEIESMEALEHLITTEEKHVAVVLHVAVRIVPKLLGMDGVKKSKTTGACQITKKAKTKAVEYYQQILWGEVGNYLEHVVLWWGSVPLASRSPHSSQHLREWILQFTPAARVPPAISSALHVLSDALGCHVTSTSWDLHFKTALVTASRCTCSPVVETCNGGTGGTATGGLFADTLKDLVHLSNQCEVTDEWIAGAPLEELPIVEQIPVLHRLDHTVHTTRLWALAAARRAAATWRVDSFFAVAHADVRICSDKLRELRLASRATDIASVTTLDVHVNVVANMREKLISEVKANIDQLHKVTTECLDVMAKICRTYSLANLQLVFPDSKYWKSVEIEPCKEASSYVATYLDRVLLPVLAATDDPIVSNTVLRIMCEAWLDHIYARRVRFSRRGAQQLLRDFAAVADWLVGCAIVGRDVRRRMLRNEVLRRCEGVARLLLRVPGDRVRMQQPGAACSRVADDDTEQSSDSASKENMPAEMYVPNQEQWLELRVFKKRPMLPPSMCCVVPIEK